MSRSAPPALTAEQSALVKANRRLAYAYARKWLSTGLLLEDLEQEALCGLMLAVQTFDPSRSSLATWAFHKMRRACQDFVRSFREPMSISGRKAYGPQQVARLRSTRDVDDIGTGDEEQAAAEHLDRERQREQAARLWARLDAREQRVLARRYRGETQGQIARSWRITRQRVCQIEQKAVAKLHAWRDEEAMYVGNSGRDNNEDGAGRQRAGQRA